MGALLSWGLPALSLANAITPQTHHEPGYSI